MTSHIGPGRGETRHPLVSSRRSTSGGAIGGGGPQHLTAFESRFAKRLLSQSIVSRQDLSLAIEHAEHQHMPLAAAVVSLGCASEEACYAELAAAAGARLLSLDEMTPSPLALRLVPERIARRHGLLPLTVDDRTVTYAISRPFDREAEQDVSFASGRKPSAMLARPSALLDALDRHFPRQREIDLLLARVRSTASVELVANGDVTVKTDSPILALCHHLVAQAVAAHASEIHFEPTAQGHTLGFRIGGILEPMFNLAPDASMAVRDQYTAMAFANIAAKERPQDGAFRLLIDGHPVDVRLSSRPALHGEQVVMRVIDGQDTLKALDAHGYDAASLSRLQGALSRPDGLVLFTGPAGSGKTTAVYGALRFLQNSRKNLASVEDPVERQIEGVNQIQVSALAGHTTTSVLRSLLRQDPDVIMVGEIRDADAAQIVGQAAYTGHLVLGTLLNADAASAVTHLLTLGIEPFKIAESLTAVVAQRLLRQLCPDCRTRHDEDEAGRLGRKHGLSSIPASAGPGCGRCRRTGYTHLRPVADVLVPDDRVREVIGRGASAAEIRTAMRAAGCRSLRDRALQMVADGVTSIEEVDRVLAPDVSSGAAPVARSRQRVLVADDDRMMRMLLRLLLEKEGYDVREAAGDRQAVELAGRDRPDLLITNLMPPDTDGFAAIRQIRRDVALSTMPVLVLTTDDGAGIDRRVLDMGADDYLVTPFDVPVLLSRVAAVLRRTGRAAAGVSE